MNKPLTLNEALAHSTSRPRRATVVENEILYYVTVGADGERSVTLKPLDSESAPPAVTLPPVLPELGWVPGASLNVPAASPAYWDEDPNGPRN